MRENASSPKIDIVKIVMGLGRLITVAQAARQLHEYGLSTESLQYYHENDYFGHNDKEFRKYMDELLTIGKTDLESINRIILKTKPDLSLKSVLSFFDDYNLDYKLSDSEKKLKILGSRKYYKLKEFDVTENILDHENASAILLFLVNERNLNIKYGYKFWNNEEEALKDPTEKKFYGEDFMGSSHSLYLI